MAQTGQISTQARTASVPPAEVSQKADVPISVLAKKPAIDGRFSQTVIVTAPVTYTSYTISAPPPGVDGAEIAVVNNLTGNITVTLVKGNGTSSTAQAIPAASSRRFRYLAGIGTWLAGSNGSEAVL